MEGESICGIQNDGQACYIEAQCNWLIDKIIGLDRQTGRQLMPGVRSEEMGKKMLSQQEEAE